MLVLTRRIGEQIVMPDIGVVVTVLKSRGGAVRLGIAAPADIVVLRQEVCRGSRPKAKVRERRTLSDAQ
jgi:carbon storage regulator